MAFPQNEIFVTIALNYEESSHAYYFLICLFKWKDILDYF